MCVSIPKASWSLEFPANRLGGLEAANREGRPTGISKVASFPGVRGQGAWQGGRPRMTLRAPELGGLRLSSSPSANQGLLNTPRLPDTVSACWVTLTTDGTCALMAALQPPCWVPFNPSMAPTWEMLQLCILMRNRDSGLAPLCLGRGGTERVPTPRTLLSGAGEQHLLRSRVPCPPGLAQKPSLPLAPGAPPRHDLSGHPR